MAVEGKVRGWHLKLGPARVRQGVSRAAQRPAQRPAPHSGPRMWIEEWVFEKVIFCKQGWTEIDPKMVKLKPLPEEPPAKRQRMQSTEEKEAFVQPPSS